MVSRRGGARARSTLTLFMLLMAGALCCATAGVTQSGADGQRDEARLRRLAESFRCLVCQNQTLADSNAGLAADLRERIREQIRQGATDTQVEAYMVRRYGDFVLYRPPLKPRTWALWFGPFAALLIGGIALLSAVRRRSAILPRALDDNERRCAAALLASHDEGS